MKKSTKYTLLISGVALVAIALVLFYYVKTEPSRYNQNQLELIELPKDLSKNGNYYCENSRMAFHELFDFLHQNAKYRTINSERFKEVYSAEHDYMLLEDQDKLFDRFKIYDTTEKRLIRTFNVECFKTNMKCYEKYFKESK